MMSIREQRTVDQPADNGAEHRDGERDSLFLGASMKVDGQADAFDVRVRNLSEGGLMVETAQPVPSGATVQLDLRGIGWVTGTVAWCTAGRLGVALSAPIDPRKARKPVGAGRRS